MGTAIVGVRLLLSFLFFNHPPLIYSICALCIKKRHLNHTHNYLSLPPNKHVCACETKGHKPINLIV